MFNNIGGKIQKLSQIITTIGIVYFVLKLVVELVVLMPTLEYASYDIVAVSIIGMVLSCVVGCLVLWAVSVLICGFGKLVENSDIIADNSEEQLVLLKKQDSSSTSENKYCVHCGNRLEPDSKFCIYCGEPKK